ncbi:hypothetical protein AB3N59_05835 [Leptospira sp. WS92.C1]
MAEDYDMIKDENSTGGGDQDSGMDELQFEDIDSILGSTGSESSAGGLEDISIDSDPLESLVVSSGEEYPSSFENDFSFHPEEESLSVDLSSDDSLDLELTDPLIDAEIDKLLDISSLTEPNISKNSNLEFDDSFFIPADGTEHSDQDFSELDSYLTEEPDAVSFGEELDDLEDFGLADLDEEGPISLHEDDLQGVKPDFSLQDFTMNDDQPTELDHGDLSFDEDDFLSEEEGPITLSEDELGEIVSADILPADFSNSESDEEESITLSGGELDGILDGDENGWSSFSPSTIDDLGEEEEGPVSLSGSELDDILGDGTSDSVSRDDSADDLPDFITHTNNLDEEGPIALSDGELGNLLADTRDDDIPVGSDLSFGEENTPAISDFSLDGEDEEPISLSLEELDNIQSDTSSDALDDTLHDMPELEDSGFDFQTDSESIHVSEDEEPIALSEEELGNLLSDDSSSTENVDGGFSDLLGGASLSEDSGSMFGENDTFSLPVEQHLDGPDEFDLGEDSLLSDSSDFSFEPKDSVSELEGDDNEPIALSEEELGNLLSSDVLEEESVESLFDETSTGEEDDLISLPVHELDGIGEASEHASLEDDSLSFDDFELPTNDFDSLENEPASDMVSFEEEDGPIALSDEELGNLLSTGESVENSTFDFEPQKKSILDEDDTDGAIALSDEELGNLLSTQEPLEDSSFDFEPQTESVLDADEPISLSIDELDHILTDGAETETTEVAGVDADSEIDWDSEPASTPSSDSSLEDEEAIALSMDELDHLLTSDEKSETISEFPGSDSEIDWDSEPATTLSEAGLEDEEPIALSIDELDHILTDKTSPEDDEGPIALSQDELGNLLSDADTTTEDLNDILGELPTSSDLDAFESMDDNVSFMESNSSEEVIPTAETVQDPEEVILLDEYADEEELSPIEELRKVPDQTVDQPFAADAGEITPSKEEMKRIMTYLDELLGNLPDDLIREFSQSDYFELYKKLMKQIGV